MNPFRQTNNLTTSHMVPSSPSENNKSFGPEDLSKLLKSRTPKHNPFKEHPLIHSCNTFSMTSDIIFYQKDDGEPSSESEYLSFPPEENNENSEKENISSDDQLQYHENINFKLPARLLKRLAQHQNKSNKVTLPEKKAETPLTVNNNNNVIHKIHENIPLKVSAVRRDTVFVRSKTSSFVVRKNVSPSPSPEPVLPTPEKVPTNNPATLSAINRAEEDERYMNWYNSIVKTNFEIENVVVDFKKIINACVGKSSDLKNNGLDCSQYGDSEARLMRNLRKKSRAFYREHIHPIKDYLYQDIKQDRFHVRSDKNVHLDVGVQKHVTEILSSYNPLWLFIAAECVFDCEIDLAIGSNPVHVLYHHLVDRFFNFRDDAAKAKCKNVTIFFMKDKNVVNAKRHILVNFIILVHFLDAAKSSKIIEHNPALFRRDAQFKSSKEIIAQFARDYITGVGDIFKTLRNSGIPLSWQQSKIEEFSFVSTSLASDFTCGTRLARLVELIFHVDILRQLQFPVSSISRKLHNIHIVTTILKKLLPNFPQNFVDKDICNRNRERLLFIFDMLIEYHNLQLKLDFYKQAECSVIKIQRWYRGCLACRKERKEFIELRNAAILIQRYFRNYKMMKFERNQFLELKQNVLNIQRKWRSLQVMKRDRAHFLFVRKVIVIQLRFRALRLMKQFRTEFLHKKESAIKIQRFWRNLQKTRQERRKYQEIRDAVLRIQTFSRAYLARKHFKQLVARSEAAKAIQQRWRSRRLMLRTRRDYLARREALIKAVAVVQERYRARCLGRYIRGQYQKLKNASLVIQRSFRRWKQSTKFFLIVSAYVGFANMQATRIQANFRGYITRKRLDSESPLYKANRQALELAYETVNDKEKFYPSVLKSLERISKSSTILKMRMDLERLERGTCFFPGICVAVLEKDAFFRVILGSMATFNRSEPHQGLLFSVYNILVNVLQCKKIYTQKSAIMDWEGLIAISIKNWKAYAKSNKVLTANIVRVLRLVFEYPGTVTYLQKDQASIEFIVSQFRALVDDAQSQQHTSSRTPAKNPAIIKRTRSQERVLIETQLLYRLLKGPLKLK